MYLYLLLFINLVVVESFITPLIFHNSYQLNQFNQLCKYNKITNCNTFNKLTQLYKRKQLNNDNDDNEDNDIDIPQEDLDNEFGNEIEEMLKKGKKRL